MILQALCDYYDALARRGEVTPPGWSAVKVSFALDIDERGALLGVMPLKVTLEGGKKEVPQSLQVPEQVKKTSGVSANFLCENSSYFLGIDGKGKPERSRQCFAAAKELHQNILGTVDSPAARAVCAFFDTWQPEQAAEHPALVPYLEEILKGANLIFSVNGLYAQNDPALRAAWQDHRAAQSAGAVSGRCLVTGGYGTVARLHPAIKGVQGAQSVGASLVSFNAPAFESYGHEQTDGTGQGLNSPVSEEAAFRYGAVLNRLIADRRHIQYIGDTAVVYWAEDAEPLYQDLFCCGMFGGESETITDADLRGAVRALAHGDPVDVNGVPLHPDNRFYVLGLAPNAGRLSVRFFLQSTFGNFIKNVNAHYKRLDVVRPANEKPEILSIKDLIGETINPNSRVKQTDSAMTCAVFRSVLQNSRYPDSLCANILLRINAERQVTWRKAAILKAWLIQNRQMQRYEEEPLMPIRYEQQTPAFLLGCLFALLEKIQQEAIENINRTLVDKYISTASATPARVFDSLLEKSRYHLRKTNDQFHRGRDLEKLLAVYRQKSPSIPERQDHQERADFMIGYYLKHQELWTSKEDLKKMEEKNNV